MHRRPRQISDRNGHQVGVEHRVIGRRAVPDADVGGLQVFVACRATAESLDAIARSLEHLSVWSSDPERFHLQRGEILGEVRKLARSVRPKANGQGSARR